MFWVNIQSIDDKRPRATERGLKQTLPWSLQPPRGGCPAEGNLGQGSGSLYSRPGSGPDSWGHHLLVTSLFSLSVTPPVQWKACIPIAPNWVVRMLGNEYATQTDEPMLFVKLILFCSFLSHATPQLILYNDKSC